MTLSRSALVIFLLGILAYALTEWRNVDKPINNEINTELTPDFIAESLKSAIYNKTGLLSHEIEADRMEHYAGLKFTNFEQPNYTLYPKNQTSPWHVQAKEATLYNSNRVILKRNVQITATEKNSLIQTIHCKSLEVDLNTNIISSKQDIVIHGKNFTMYGSGLIIDLNTTQMTLTKHVQTIYNDSNS